MSLKILKIESGVKSEFFQPNLVNLEAILDPERVLGRSLGGPWGGLGGSRGGPWGSLEGPWGGPGGQEAL